ncbi:hypothetical protein ACMHYJ_05275 [Castellaniella hirudinis]|uniref:hypothetical protein n=1 Tax=Castellaniella hirudinis TaxID=1144617 RepID=UPI0039C13EAB
MSKPTTPKGPGAYLHCIDGVGLVKHEDLCTQPPVVISESAPVINLIDAGLTRISRVQYILMALAQADDGGDQTVMYGHLNGMLDEAYMLLNTAGIRTGGES